MQLARLYSQNGSAEERAIEYPIPCSSWQFENFDYVKST